MLKVGGVREKAGDFLLPSPLATLLARFCGFPRQNGTAMFLKGIEDLRLEKSLTGRQQSSATDVGN